MPARQEGCLRQFTWLLDHVPPVQGADIHTHAFGVDIALTAFFCARGSFISNFSSTRTTSQPADSLVLRPNAEFSEQNSSTSLRSYFSQPQPLHRSCCEQTGLANERGSASVRMGSGYGSNHSPPFAPPTFSSAKPIRLS